MHEYDEIYEIAGNLFNNRHTEVEEYDLLNRMVKLCSEYRRDIAYTELTGNNYTYAANMLVVDAYRYIKKYIEDNDINIHGTLLCTGNGEYPSYGGERVYKVYVVFDKDFYKYIKTANDINVKLQSIRKKLVFKTINEDERQFLTLSQLNKFMDIRKKNPKYVEAFLDNIINALDSIKYKEDPEEN